MNPPTAFFLQVNEGAIKGQTFSLGVVPLIAGRQEDCDIVLPNDSLASRKHAQFTVENGVCFVQNLESMNGVYVNRVKIQQKQSLKPGDEIIIGNHLFLLSTASNAPPSPSAGPPSDTQPSSAPSPDEGPGGSASASSKSSPYHAARRLHLLYQLNLMATQTVNFQNLSRMILKLIFQDLRMSRGCIYLLNSQTNQMEPQCFLIRGREEGQSLFQPLQDLLNVTVQEGRITTQEGAHLQSHGITFAMGIPLLDGKRFLGLIYLDTQHPDFRFGKTDREFLEALSLQATAALLKSQLEFQVNRDHELLKQLEKHVGPEIMRLAREKKVNLDTSDLETQEKEVAILFSDIVGFTSLSERLTPGDIAFLLNGYFNQMEECVAKYYGYLNKYIGDAIMAVFGAPFTRGNDSENAIRCALEMRHRLQLFWKTIDESKRFQIRIGINTGVVIAGNIGSLNRMEYTVIGDAVNLASRLESNAKPLSILIGETTHEKVKGIFPVRPMDPIKVKGKEHPVRVFEILQPNG
jgi:adenylate cyclase